MADVVPRLRRAGSDDGTRHVTVPVAVFKDKVSADAELDRLKAANDAEDVETGFHLPA